MVFRGKRASALITKVSLARPPLLDGAIIPGLQHIDTARLAFQTLWPDKTFAKNFANTFSFNSPGWKEASGEYGKEGWVKQIPKGHLPKDFKVDGRAPRGETVKVFIEYLGPRVA